MTRFHPRGSALDLLKSRASVVIASGPAGTGKTYAALIKAHLTSLLVPNCVTLLLRATHSSLTASTLREFETGVAVNELASGEVKWFGGSGSKPAAYMYQNGSLIIPGGLDQPGKFLSMSVDKIYVDEASQVSKTAIEVLSTRLRGSAGVYRQMCLMTNPDHPEHHLMTMVKEGRAEIIYSHHTDNPSLYHGNGELTETGADYMATLRRLTGVRRARYLDGSWVAAEGLVFDDWRDDVNLIDPFEVPEDWDAFWTVDFGYQNSFVWQCWRVDPDGRMYLTHEIARRQRLVEDHARDILELMAANGLRRPSAIVCDHDSEDRATLERHLKMPTVAAKKGVARGVQLMQTRVRKAGDERPRLYVFRTAILNTDPMAKSDNRPRGLAAEVNGYVWAMDRGPDGIPKEAPKKLNDHSMDAGRYAVAHLDWNEESKVGNPAKPQSGDRQASGSWSRPVGR